MPRPLIESLDNRRLFATYAPDVTFAGDGTLPTLDGAAAFVAVRDGGIITGGLFRDETTGPQLHVARFHADGTNDRDFHSGARLLGDEAVAVSIVGADLQARPFLTASKGNIAYINRLRAQGSRDRGFAATLTPPDSQLRTTTVDQVQSTTDGSVLAVVRVTGGSTVSTYIAKLSSTGQLDVDFGVNGYAAIGRAKLSNTNTGPAVWFAADASGRIYVSVEGQPSVEGQHSIVRLRASGSRDVGFARKGVIKFDLISKAALDNNGRLLVYEQSSFNLYRFTTTGAKDTTFGTNGRVQVTFDGIRNSGIALLPQSDSLVYIQVDKSVARFREDGTLDTRFDTDGVARLPTGGRIEAVLPHLRFLQRYGSDLKAVAPLEAVTLGRSGTLYIHGNAANDTVEIHPDTNVVRVAFGTDTYGYIAPITAISADLGRGNNVFTSTLNMPTTVITGDGRDRITTGDADDSVYSGAGSDRIFTFAGNDFLSPGAGNNTIDGGAGRDRYLRGSPTDELVGIETTLA